MAKKVQMIEHFGSEKAWLGKSAIIASRAIEIVAARKVAMKALEMGCDEAVISTSPGLVAARNEAVEASRGNWIVMLDSDVELEGTFYGLRPSGRLGLWVPTYATASKDTYSRIGVKFANFANRFNWPFSIGCCMAFTRSAYLEIGGLDPKWAWDDLSFGLRVRQAGYQQTTMPVTAISTRPFTLAIKYLGRVHA